MKKLFLFFLAVFCIGTFAPKVVTPLIADDTVTLVADSSESETVCSEDGMQCDSSQNSNSKQKDDSTSFWWLLIVFLILIGAFD